MAGADAPALHVLFVAWGFDRERGVEGAEASRSLDIVAELVRHGHRVTVLTADLATLDDLVRGEGSKLVAVPEDVRVVRVAMAPRQREHLINRWPAARMANPEVWVDKVEKEEVAAFPEELYAPWQPRAEAVATRIHELDPVDLVIATGQPYVDFSVALRLHVDHSIPFVLEDRGRWLQESSTGAAHPLAGRILPWLEFALSETLQMWFVDPANAELYRHRFPEHADRIRVVDDHAEAAIAPALADVVSALSS